MIQQFQLWAHTPKERKLSGHLYTHVLSSTAPNNRKDATWVSSEGKMDTQNVIEIEKGIIIQI